jgi:lipopolysaccharide export system protein LptA
MQIIKLFLILLFTTISVYALTTDEIMPIEIHANNAEFDQKNKIYIFNGNVLITRGSININANKGIVTQLKNNNQIELEGTPIKFSQKQDNGDIISGYCDHFDYDSTSNIATLKGNAKIKKGNNNVAGEIIKYNTKTEVYSVNSTKSSNINNKLSDRVTIILDDINNATKSNK